MWAALISSVNFLRTRNHNTKTQPVSNPQQDAEFKAEVDKINQMGLFSAIDYLTSKKK
jgi:hypothetical protein